MSQRFTEEFKTQAVKQVIEHNYSVASVSEMLGVANATLCNWVRRYGLDSTEHKTHSIKT